MKKLKRCPICNKYMWRWQPIWMNTMHLACMKDSVDIIDKLNHILEKSKK